jgi:hypothetical protein
MSLPTQRTHFVETNDAPTPRESVFLANKPRPLDGFGLFAVALAAAGLVATLVLLRRSPSVPSAPITLTIVPATPTPLRPNAADICDRDGNCWVP